MKLKGISTSRGIAFGNVFRLSKKVIDTAFVKVENTDETIKAFHDAVALSKSQLEQLAEKTRLSIGEHESKIFLAHAMMLEDPEFIEPIEAVIRDEAACVPYAVECTRQSLVAIFSAMDNAYMRERAADITDISNRVIKNALGIVDNWDLPMNTILCCEDLEPSDTAMLDPKQIAGIITVKGGETSHSAIIAKSLNIPALSKIEIPNHYPDGTAVILDALNGLLILEPSDADTSYYADAKVSFEQEISRYEVGKMDTAKSSDGFEMEIAANIAATEGLEAVLEAGADGVGLFRTEFLYMNRTSPPTLEEQFEAYKKVLTAFGSKPMVIRTFDIGGDKQIDYLNMDKEMNPFLGYRAIRISLDRLDLFKVQLKALLMASIYGNLKIMFPMISSVEEIQKIKKIMADIRCELEAEGTPYRAVEIGIMVEIPAVAVRAKQFAKHVDFFSIGTNDLLQYTVAVDRMNEKLSHLYTWYHPGLLSLIHNVAKSAKEAGIWVGICGESAADPLLLPFFLGCGIDELSMSQSKIAEIKWRLKSLSQKEMTAVVERVLEMDTAEAVEAYLSKL